MDLKIKVEQEYDIEKAICNHGYFMTAPNQWISSTKTFRRPLRLEDGCSSVMVSISLLSPPQSSSLKILSHDPYLLIRVNADTSLSQSNQHHIQKQVERMLRLTNKDEDDIREFKKVHSKAVGKGFGRLFRSPDLFEDIIKTILLCNTTFNRTLQMCESLCELQANLHSGKPKEPSPAKRGRPRKLGEFFRNNKKSLPPSSSNGASKAIGNFPSPKELAGFSEAYLKEHCKLGFRAKCILKLAKSVENGKLNLLDIEKLNTFDSTFYDQIRSKLIKFKGIGPFAAANILMCMGDYRNIPTDSESIHHLREIHHISKCTAATVQTDAKEVYKKYAPYQCLAYWYELIESYERKLGTKLSELPPSNYHKVASGSYLSNNKLGKDLEEEQRVNAAKRKRTRSQLSI